ncbi:MAG: esterase [Christensenellaceae bacterium]|nr:esterase [Christensenellaceae bacterium]
MERIIGDKACRLYGDSRASDVLIQPVDEHDLEALDQEIACVRELTSGQRFLLAAFQISDWNRELSPWEAPAVFGRESFGAGAKDTLAYITGTLMPEIASCYPTEETKRYYLGGYSLAGLFSLWAAYQTDLFQGIAAVSPSVWFPQWTRYAEEHEMRSPRVYLSLGDKEEKTRNRVMAEVGSGIRRQHELLRQQDAVKACTLEWNPGNHFVDSGLRTGKGFAWLLNQT